ncbi:hypothetical protein [Anabaena azotica]|uniref:Uncharacterized protein n=1 Tax=Anabaena azotica FACHB-119 TaxID=947527 RepID=A0ABR8DES5_9NOST|nr:hypothetical protein [Anabaena azotica]MBD2505614.1 hypothetical protein [Anabaena azotica FACHB-119]
MTQDLSNSNAAKNRHCCICGKYCQEEEIYFPELVQCLNCYTLQDVITAPKLFIIPRSE